MTSRNIFIRKIIYGVLIALLLIPLYKLGGPATIATRNEKADPGGKLAQVRKEYGLSEVQLGEIDPTSVTIKLATLGLRGVAANILWEKAIDYKMRKDWANFGGTLNQITKVQPHFINVWTNQAWNLSYNCSVQFDDYRERYRWVIKGFDFLKEGMKYNERQPLLQHELGRMVSQKIGKADEVKQYRRLFKEDDDFNAGVPVALRDNWLVGKQWYEKAVEMVDTMPGVTMMGKSPLLYLHESPLCQMYYAEGLEKDGTFGEVAKGAWATAGREWHHYGEADITTPITLEGAREPLKVHLNDQEMHEAAAKKLIVRLDSMQPGLREKIIAEKKAKLTPQQRQALEVPAPKRNAKEYRLVQEAEEATKVTHDEVAHRITGTKRKKEAIRLAKEIAQHEQIAFWINHNREVVAFVDWRRRADAEQTPELLTARKLVYQGDRAFAENDPVAARNFYRDGLAAWRKVIDLHHEYLTDQVSGEDLVDMIKRYRRILGQLDERFPEPFILQDVLDKHQK
jgi:hypothetical protein